MDPFKDQFDFMVAMDQKVDGSSVEQERLYESLVQEEVRELAVAMTELYVVASKCKKASEFVVPLGEVAKESMDVIVVLIGMLYSMGIDPSMAWYEVHQSNMRKLNPDTGKPDLDERGKVIKPKSWAPPDMSRVICASYVSHGRRIE